MDERASMNGLIDFVEKLIGDTTNQNHSREDIQDALDVYRVEARYEPLSGVVSYPGGVAAYLTFDAATGYWETDATFYDASYDAITPAANEWTAGRWTFGTAPARPVMIVGWTHDPYQAAADLLETRAAQLAEAYDFKTGPDSYSRSQMHKQLLAQAARTRAMSPRVKAQAQALLTGVMPEVTFDVFRW